MVFAVTTATLVLASVFVAARVVCRVGIVRNVSKDDYLIILAWLLAFFLSFTIDLGTVNGLGLHDADIDPNDKAVLRKCEYVFSILYVSTSFYYYCTVSLVLDAVYLTHLPFPCRIPPLWQPRLPYWCFTSA